MYRKKVESGTEGGERMRKFLGRHKGLLSMEVIGILLCVLFSFRPEQLVFYADAEEITSKMTAEDSDSIYRSEEFVLKPGVYRLQVYGNDHEGMWYPTVSSTAGTFQAVRCNGAAVFAHQREMDFEVYVIDRVDTAVVSCSYIGEEGQPVNEISLYHTGSGWRMLAFLLFLAAAGANLLIWFREGIRESRIRRDSEIAVWGLGFCVLLAYLPYTTDYFATGADGAFHLLRIEGLKETLLHGGQFPVRVQEYWVYGHGYAVSSFYGDLFLLFPAILRLIGFHLMEAYKMFVLAILIGTAGIAYYSFYRCTGNRYAALLGSALYELAPYHIYNFYNRNAVGECLGMMFLPLVISGIYRIYTENQAEACYTKAKIPLIIGLSGILQSHILTCEMTVAALFVTAVVMWKKTFQKAILKELIEVALCCLLANAWFWVPLLKMLTVDSYMLGDIVSQNIQNMGTRLAGILQIYPYVGGGQTGMYNCEPIQAGGAFWTMLLCCFFLRARRRRIGRPQNPYDRIMRCGISLSLLVLFMSTRYFPWDMAAKIPGIGMLATSIQFPTRLLSAVTLFCAFTFSFFVLWVREECKGWEEQAGKVIAASCILAVSVTAIWAALYHVNDISYNMKPVRLYTAENMGSISVVNGEYLLSYMNLEDMEYHDPVADEGLLWENYTKEGLEIRMYIENPTGRELYVELPLTGYRGYRLEAGEGVGKPYVTEDRGAHGDLRVAVPAGYAGNIKVSYKGFTVYRVAEGVSILFILICIGMCIARRYRGKKTLSFRYE